MSRRQYSKLRHGVTRFKVRGSVRGGSAFCSRPPDVERDLNVDRARIEPRRVRAHARARQLEPLDNAPPDPSLARRDPPVNPADRVPQTLAALPAAPRRTTAADGPALQCAPSADPGETRRLRTGSTSPAWPTESAYERREPQQGAHLEQRLADEHRRASITAASRPARSSTTATASSAASARAAWARSIAPTT